MAVLTSRGRGKPFSVALARFVGGLSLLGQRRYCAVLRGCIGLNLIAAALVASGCGSGAGDSAQGTPQGHGSEDADGGAHLSDALPADDVAMPDAGAGSSAVSLPIAPTSSGLIEEDDPPVIDPEAVPGTRCEREVSFEAVQLARPGPFDVIIVADHSDSLSWSREELANGLSGLLDEVYGHDARFFVLTPTQYGKSSANAMDWITGEQLVPWYDPVTQDGYENEITRYTQSCVDGDGQALTCPPYPGDNQEFTLRGRFELVMPEPIATITSEMDTAELAEQQALLTAAILNLSGGASQVEQPMCTLNRYILQAPSLLPKNAIFLVISDEDDTSQPQDCVGGYEFARYPIGGMQTVNGCTADCDAWRFLLRRPMARRSQNFACVPVDDFGTTFPDQAVNSASVLSDVVSCEAAVRECDGSEQAAAADECGPGFLVEDCSVSCTEGTEEALCGVELNADAVDACSTAFEYEGAQYADLNTFCEQHYPFGAGWQDCQREGLFLEEVPMSWGGSSVKSALVDASNVLGMIRAFQAEATQAFGADGFYVATIAFDPAFSCEPETGQSHATTLRMVSKGPADVFPICESYAPALSKVSAFAEALLPTEYTLELGDRESIESVSVSGRDGEPRELDPAQYTYDAASANLSIEASALQASDVTLDVTIADPCARMVR